MDRVGILVSGGIGSGDRLSRSVPISGGGLYDNMGEMAGRLGLQVALVDPVSFRWEAREAESLVYDRSGGRWRRARIAIPFVILDRCFYLGPRQWRSYRETVRLCRANGIRIIGSGMRGKWETYLLMRKDPDLRPHLPETGTYRGADSLREWLGRERELFCKPHGGMHGRGTVHIRRGAQGACEIRGRDPLNRRFHLSLPDEEAVWTWFHRFAGGRKYIIQPYLDLCTASGLAYDIRALVQKNGEGKWTLTGMAARIGEPGSATSNLHGGGTACDASGFLQAEFGADRAEQLLEKILFLVRRVPPLMEQSFGHFFELGIDLGVDRSGNVWLLEVNSKPGRSIFKRLGKRTESVLAVRNPLLYARRLMGHAPAWRGFPRAFPTLGG